MKRKSLHLNRQNATSDELFKQTYFYKTFSEKLSRGLKDNSEPISFIIDGEGRYQDDPKREKYEIATLNGEEYFVFVFSLFHVAYPVDEAAFFELVRTQFKINFTSLRSHSTFNDLKITISIQVAMMLVFFLIMYILFPQLRSTVFGFIDKRGWNSKYSPVAKSEEQASKNEMS